MENPWTSEPDWLAGEYKGYTYFIKRNDLLGFLMGYVFLTQEDKYYGEEAYDDIPLDCHGSLTYSDFASHLGDFPSSLWAIGFDCGHAFDLIPMLAGRFKGKALPGWMNADQYRTMDYVKEQCEHIIEQILEGKQDV